MNQLSKQKYLQAWDLLQEITNARVHTNPHPTGKGGGGFLSCDVCNGPLGMAVQHSPECPVGNALKAMSPGMPKPVFVPGESIGRNGREEYLTDDTQPQIPFTPPQQPQF